MGVNSTNKGYIGNLSYLKDIGIESGRNNYIEQKNMWNDPQPYTRPTEWVSLPSITAGEQKIAGVYAVYNNDSNFVAFTCQGAYNVDWGDGTTGAFSSNTTAYKQYTTTTYAGLTSSVFREYKTLVITITPQSGQNFTSVTLNTRHNQAGLATYYNNQWLDIKIAGNNISSFAFGGDAYWGLTIFGMLEQFEWVNDGALTSFYNLFTSCNKLRKIVKLPKSDNVTSCYQTFYGCTNLKEVPFFNTSKVTSFERTFASTALLNIPPIDTSSATNMFQMFSSCLNIKTIPYINTAKVTEMGAMFANCFSLQTIPLLNTSAVTNMAIMFYNCNSLREIPQLDTSNVTNMDRMFFTTTSLKEVPKLNTSKVTNMYQMFAQTYPQGGGLEKAPEFDTSNVTNMQEMFYFNDKLERGATLDTSKVTNMSGMYWFCYNLKSIPQYNTSKVTDFSHMLRNTNIETIPQMNISSGLNFLATFATNYSLIGFSGFTFHGGTGTWQTNAFQAIFSGCRTLQYIGECSLAGVCSASSYASIYTSMFNECWGLQTIGFTGIQHSFSIAEAKLGPTALNNLYQSLAVVGASGSGTKTITVTGNWGAASDNPNIAIEKGWTVTG